MAQADRSALRMSLLVSSMLLLTACGQKGPLVLPKAAASAAAPAASAAASAGTR